jgi:leader peptidase (prepilin peptidase)/N-methyltransferase
MIRIFGTIFATLLGLAFGSFLNLCLTRWPEEESVVKPRSHCRQCGHTLAWWENLPLASWLLLRGRCGKCRAWIGIRYPLVELAVALLWAASAWQALPAMKGPSDSLDFVLYTGVATALGKMIFYWALVALAVLDAENFWLPDWITWPGIALGFLFTFATATFAAISPLNDAPDMGHPVARAVVGSLTGALLAAGLVLFIRWLYGLFRHREGMGFGDAKLMALLAAWIGFPQALLAFAVGIVLGALFAVVLLASPAPRAKTESWPLSKLPLGTFLCIGGVVSSLWGAPILSAYLGWAGF